MSGGRGGPAPPARAVGADGNPTTLGGGGWSGHGDYMRAKEAKLQEQYAAHEPLISEIFRGVVVHLDGNSSERSADLVALVASHGGSYSQFYHGEFVTHFVANVLPAAKIRQMTAHLAESRRKGRQVYVVREEWLLESTRQVRRLPEVDFACAELQDPEQGTLRGFVKRPVAAAAAAAAATSHPPALAAAAAAARRAAPADPQIPRGEGVGAAAADCARAATSSAIAIVLPSIIVVSRRHLRHPGCRRHSLSLDRHPRLHRLGRYHC